MPPVGSNESLMYYYNVASIAINYLEIFRMEYELGRGWNKVSVNMINTKNKIIGLLLSLRRVYLSASIRTRAYTRGVVESVCGGDCRYEIVSK